MFNKLEIIAESSFIHEYTHHPYQIENHLTQFLNSTEEEYQNILSLDTYINILAPTPLRAIKNSLISFLTVYCRIAIDLGLSAEKSFSVSDFFINEIEKSGSKEQLQIIYTDILYGYKHLLEKNRTVNYSFHINKSMKYIHENLYGQLYIKEISDYLEINERYFCTIFKKEVGISPKKYILKNKINTSISLLTNNELSIADISEMLGFSDPPHFSHTFRKQIGIPPTSYRKYNLFKK